MIVCTDNNELFSFDVKKAQYSTIHKCGDDRFVMNYPYMCPACFIPKTNLAALPSSDRNCIIYWDCQNNKEVFRHNSSPDDGSMIQYVRVSRDGKKIIWTNEDAIWVANAYEKESARKVVISDPKIRRLSFIDHRNLFIAYGTELEAVLDTDNRRLIVSGQKQPQGGNSMQVPLLDRPLVAYEYVMDSIIIYDPIDISQRRKINFPFWFARFLFLSPTRIAMIPDYRQGNFGQTTPVYLEIWDLPSMKCIVRSRHLGISNNFSIIGYINSNLYLANRIESRIEIYDIGDYLN